MRLRAADNADCAAIKDLVFSVLNEYSLAPDPTGTDSDLSDIESHYQDHGGYFAVGELERRIVATVGVYRVDQTTCEIRKMYLLSEHRGKGWGRHLLEFALVKARDLGFERVVLETASPLHEAIALYRQYGFTPITNEHLAQRCDQAFELKL